MSLAPICRTACWDPSLATYDKDSCARDGPPRPGGRHKRHGVDGGHALAERLAFRQRERGALSCAPSNAPLLSPPLFGREGQ